MEDCCSILEECHPQRNQFIAVMATLLLLVAVLAVGLTVLLKRRAKERFFDRHRQMEGPGIEELYEESDEAAEERNASSKGELQ